MLSAMASAFAKPHVDLVLRRDDLVVVVLDLDADRLERRDRVVAHLRRGVLRRHREVAALVDRLRALIVVEDEVLELGADVEGVEADLAHPLERRAARCSADRPRTAYRPV